MLTVSDEEPNRALPNVFIINIYIVQVWHYVGRDSENWNCFSPCYGCVCVCVCVGVYIEGEEKYTILDL